MQESAEESMKPMSDPRTEMAEARTRLAWDRTLLAWSRSALALITAGVAFDRGTRLLHEARLMQGIAWVHTGHLGGLCLTAVSTVLLIIVTWNHLAVRRETPQTARRGLPLLAPPVIAAGVVIAFGGVVFVLLFTNPG